MREHENRYRKSSSPAPSGGDQRQRYQKAAEKKHASSKQMTYDDFLKDTSDIDKLLELDESSVFDKFSDYKAEYSPRIKAAFNAQKAKLPPVPASASSIPIKVYAGIGVSVLAIGVLGLTLIGGPADDSGVAEVESGEVASVTDANLPQKELDFTPAVPDGIDRTTDVVYDAQVGVATLRDTISGFPVTVSQQPLLDQQKVAPQTALSEVAVALQAQVTLGTEKGSAYVATPITEDGGDPSQTIVFVYNDLLFFLRTNGASISNEAFIEYINTIK